MRGLDLGTVIVLPAGRGPGERIDGGMGGNMLVGSGGRPFTGLLGLSGVAVLFGRPP